MKKDHIGRRQFLQTAAVGAASSLLGRKAIRAERSDSKSAARNDFSAHSPDPWAEHPGGKSAVMAAKGKSTASSRCTIATYYCPLYHPDPRREKLHGKGWTEWELMKYATPRFEGHQQPKVPLWGYEDESDPVVMAKKIDAAADHGIDVFFYDWFWYDDGPFLQRCLEEGFLKAPNNNRLKFAIFWCNHDWWNFCPMKRVDPQITLFPGAVTRKTFDAITDHVVNRYFKHPSYWLIDGRPYFSFFYVKELLNGLGGIEEMKKALDDFQAKTKAAGFPGLHLAIRDKAFERNKKAIIDALGFDSFTSYGWMWRWGKKFPESDYRLWLDSYMQYWQHLESQHEMPYIPNVTMGWDKSPRTIQSDVYSPPFWPVFVNNTPAEFRKSLELVKQRLAERSRGPNALVINAWNEWTEGSYLEPDTIHGMGYLEAIKEVFPR